jgi:hypothetical protein
MKSKVCSKCGKEKDINEFHKRSREKDGLYNFCKECVLGHKPQIRNTPPSVVPIFMKWCSKCGVIKYQTDFYPDKRARDNLQCHCKDCKIQSMADWVSKNPMKHKDNGRNWREANPERFHELNTKYQRERAYKFTRNVFNYFHGYCFICKIDDPIPRMYDCHHVDPLSKFKNVSEMWKYNWDVVIIEMDKCILLCANCHRKLEAGAYDNDIISGKLVLIPGKPKRIING